MTSTRSSLRTTVLFGLFAAASTRKCGGVPPSSTASLVISGSYEVSSTTTSTASPASSSSTLLTGSGSSETRNISSSTAEASSSSYSTTSTSSSTNVLISSSSPPVSLSSSTLSTITGTSRSLISSLSSTSSTTSSSMITPTPDPNLTTITSCPSPTYIGEPHDCIISMPAVCATLSPGGAFVPPFIVPTIISACSNQFSRPTAVAATVASCFNGAYVSPYPTASIYSCVSDADVYCSFSTPPCTTVTQTRSSGSITATSSETATGTAVPTTYPNVLENGGFDTGSIEPWGAYDTFNSAGSAHGVRPVAEPHSGSSYVYELAWTASLSTVNIQLSQQVYVASPGSPHKLSFWFRSSNSAENCYGLLQITPSGAGSAAEAHFQYFPEDEWTYVESEQAFSPTGTEALVYFQVGCAASDDVDAENTIWIDDISLARVG